MASRISGHGRVVLMLWGKPEIEDLVRLEEFLEERIQTHGKVVFIPRVPINAEAPDPQFRNTLSAMMPRLYARCLSYHAVLEGSGFVSAVKRTAMAGISLMARKRYHIQVHATVDEVVGAVDPELRIEVMAALRHFRTLGMLDHHLTSLVPPPRIAV